MGVGREGGREEGGGREGGREGDSRGRTRDGAEEEEGSSTSQQRTEKTKDSLACSH